jgi:hypothetical protein
MLPGFEIYEWNSVFVPAGAPREVIDDLMAALSIPLSSSAWRSSAYRPDRARRKREKFKVFVRAETQK